MSRMVQSGIRSGAPGGSWPGVGAGGAHLAAPEVTDCAVAAGEDVEGRDVRILGADVVAGVGPAHVRIEPEPRPAALLLESDEPCDRRARHHHEGDALLDVPRLAVPGGEQGGA